MCYKTSHLTFNFLVSTGFRTIEKADLVLRKRKAELEILTKVTHGFSDVIRRSANRAGGVCILI